MIKGYSRPPDILPGGAYYYTTARPQFNSCFRAGLQKGAPRRPWAGAKPLDQRICFSLPQEKRYAGVFQPLLNDLLFFSRTGTDAAMQMIGMSTATGMPVSPVGTGAPPFSLTSMALHQAI